MGVGASAPVSPSPTGSPSCSRSSSARPGRGRRSTGRPARPPAGAAGAGHRDAVAGVHRRPLPLQLAAAGQRRRQPPGAAARLRRARRRHVADGQRAYAWLALRVLLLACFAVARLRRGRTGAALTALRSSEPATAAMGFSVVVGEAPRLRRLRLPRRARRSAVRRPGAGASGAPFDFTRSITLLAYAVIVGVASVPGALLGGVIVTLSTLSSAGRPGRRRRHRQPRRRRHRRVLVFVVLAPGGVTGGSPAGLSPPAGPARARSRRRWRLMAAALELRDVGVRFGAFDAVDGVSLSVHAGEVVGLIGPNGAGKTVTFNVVTGLQPPTRGRSCSTAGTSPPPPRTRTALGLARTFQVVQLFAGMTVLENLMVAAHRFTRAGVLRRAPAPLARSGAAQARERARAVLAYVGLTHLADVDAGSLPVGQARLVELARALCLSRRCCSSTSRRRGSTPVRRPSSWSCSDGARDPRLRDAARGARHGGRHAAVRPRGRHELRAGARSRGPRAGARGRACSRPTSGR